MRLSDAWISGWFPLAGCVLHCRYRTSETTWWNLHDPQSTGLPILVRALHPIKNNFSVATRQICPSFSLSRVDAKGVRLRLRTPWDKTWGYSYRLKKILGWSFA
jgi:hypothetical protein